jgi:hypothetical protein
MRARPMPARAVLRAPSKGGEDQEIDRRIFQNIDAVREQRHRADGNGNGELDAKVPEVEQSNEADNAA